MHFFSCSIEYGSNYFGRSLYTKTRNGTEQLKATFRPVPPTKIRNSPLVPLTGSRSLDVLLNRAAESTRAFYKFAYCEYTQFRILVGVHFTLEYGSNYVHVLPVSRPLVCMRFPVSHPLIRNCVHGVFRSCSLSNG